MRLKDIASHIPETGICQIDTEKAVRYMNRRKTALISRWKDEYTIACVSGGRLRISKQDAEVIIEKMQLIERASPIFNSGYIYTKMEDDS